MPLAPADQTVAERIIQTRLAGLPLIHPDKRLDKLLPRHRAMLARGLLQFSYPGGNSGREQLTPTVRWDVSNNTVITRSS